MPQLPQSEQLSIAFREQDVIDVQRAAAILGVTPIVVYRLIDDRAIDCVLRRPRSPFLVPYWSLVEYCDHLREKHGIPNRRPPLTGPRYRDEDVLPFPLSDTVYVRHAMDALHALKQTVHLDIESGRYEAYQLRKESDWRISRTSLEEYTKRIHRRARAL